MRIESEIKKWGNSLALRVTGIMAELPKFKVGTKVIVDVTDEGFTVKPAPPEGRGFRFPFSEEALLAGMTPEKAHADALAEPTASEFGD